MSDIITGDIITFTIPTDQYITDIRHDLYDSDDNDSGRYLAVNSRYNTEDFTKAKAISHADNVLMFTGCGGFYDDVLVQKIEIKDNTVKMALETKDKAQSEVIKKGAAKCGFKVE